MHQPILPYPILKRLIVSVLFLGIFLPSSWAHSSIARQWNEVLLEGIRHDFARPTVHARNLFHVSIAMYDIWAIYDETATPYLIGKTVDGFTAPFAGIEKPPFLHAALDEAISYASYRLIKHRFKDAPGRDYIYLLANTLLLELGYDTSFVSVDYLHGSPGALGNYVAGQIIQFGLQDGSNEADSYRNQYYEPVNMFTNPRWPGVTGLSNPNRWQPLGLGIFIDQGGNPVEDGAAKFLSPEWGWVTPFAMTQEDSWVYTRDGFAFKVYHDPGDPPKLDYNNPDGYYRRGFEMVAIWSSHLDPADSVVWDISPASIGNTDIDAYPTNLEDLLDYYTYFEGGDIGKGHAINPHTGQPYEPNLVLRGDYTRVLAEFWADGPDSETPPGHWFALLNYVNSHPDLVKRWKGEGPLVDPLEWDVKCYFTLGGAMHDAAISAWSIKGYYDYIRPMSAIRFMGRGQLVSETLPNFFNGGMNLIPGYIEQVKSGDPLAGDDNENVGKIKLKAWRGPTYINNPETDEAGVGWILAENWWPYQRPSFVTPPFAGYVSGHSTFSRAAADLLTEITGDPFFPGGMGEFEVKKNEFLVFEEGPSQSFTLQWATYRDASDQTSLSRIWGGIHPPADDIPGRLIGGKVAEAAFAHAEKYFKGEVEPASSEDRPLAFPNPLTRKDMLTVSIQEFIQEGVVQFIALDGRLLHQQIIPEGKENGFMQIPMEHFAPGIYVMRIKGKEVERSQKIVVGP